MEAPLSQGMGSAQGEEKTCCEIHVVAFFTGLAHT
jgi:hypothetical protein